MQAALASSIPSSWPPAHLHAPPQKPAGAACPNHNLIAAEAETMEDRITGDDYVWLDYEVSVGAMRLIDSEQATVNGQAITLLTHEGTKDTNNQTRIELKIFVYRRSEFQCTRWELKNDNRVIISFNHYRISIVR